MTITDNSLKMLNKYRKDRPKPITDKTFNNYVSVFEAVERNIQADFSTIDQNKLVALLKKSNLSTTAQSKFLILLNAIRKRNEFEKYLLELNTTIASNTKQRTQSQLSKTNISYKDLISLLSTFTGPLSKLEGHQYILLYLLLAFGVRNTDLIVEITDDPIVIDNVLNGSLTKNILYFKNDKLFYTRNNYKNKATYGVITLQLDDPKFKEIVRSLDDGFVFVKRTGTAYDETEMGNLIKRTLNKYFKNSNLTESIIYKIQTQHFSNNPRRQTELARTRPHSLTTQYNNYE